eukprot:gnl/TRDRNA2_/TRDRNA2_81560_c0_seq1.p1 gnl/TRDRNA2_/TRDRNA2_81560_c0~~gnl/TRDRNA2_/TRDRNA2_81560_c0_seq1.p1  ORF type:complete len:290 (-),score=44.95 gnl/TRDRNA2_/TRDRNA2_81560_c0_seq1:232-1101(-)
MAAVRGGFPSREPPILQPPPPGRFRDLKAIAADESGSQFFPPGTTPNSTAYTVADSRGASKDHAGSKDHVPAGEIGLPGVEDAHIRKAFKEIDYNKTGYVGASELRYMLMLLGERPTDEELDEMLRMLDTDGSGRVAYDEFRSLFELDSVVLAEMLTMQPVAADEPEEDEPDSPGSEKNPQTPEADINLKKQGALAFLHAVDSRKRDDQRARMLPHAKVRAGPGATGEESAGRVRPEGSGPTSRGDVHSPHSAKSSRSGTAGRGSNSNPSSPKASTAAGLFGALLGEAH